MFQDVLARGVFNLIDQDGVQKIHDASVRVLNRTGVRVHDTEMLRLAGDAGADVDEKTGVVKLSEAMVVDAINTAPSEIELCDRAGRSMPLSRGTSYCGTCANVPYILDFDSDGTREATRQDVGNLVRIADHLPNIDIISTPVRALDVPACLSALYEWEGVLLNTSKHWFASPAKLVEAQTAVELAEVVSEHATVGEAPFLTMVISTTSPLVFDQESVNMVALAAEKKIPFVTLPVPVAGGTSPVTLAGTAVMQNSEFLFSLTLSQIKNPGTPVIYGAVSSTMDMRTGSVSRGDVEYALLAHTVCRLAEFYRVPSYGVHAMTESPRLDMYNGAQKMFCILAGLASGANVSRGAGQLSSAKLASYEQLVLDDELYEIARRFLWGIRVDEETLAVSTIEKVGPGRHYLMEEHTRKFLRSSERLYSDYFVPGMWERGSRESIVYKAHEKAQEILDSHVSRVPRNVAETVRDYVREKEKELRGVSDM